MKKMCLRIPFSLCQSSSTYSSHGLFNLGDPVCILRIFMSSFQKSLLDSLSPHSDLKCTLLNAFECRY